MQEASSPAGSDCSSDQDLELPDAEAEVFAGERRGSWDITGETDKLKLELADCQEQLAAASDNMNFFRTSATKKDCEIEHLREQVKQTTLSLRHSESQVNSLKREKVELQHHCSNTAAQVTEVKRELKKSQQNFNKERTEHEKTQQQLVVLTQHFSDEKVRKSGGCTLLIKFDTQQREKQYTSAVTSLLQPIEDKYVLDVKIVQKPKTCDFLLYVTFSSTERLLNFSNTDYEDFKQGCSTDNAVVLVIHRNQSDPVPVRPQQQGDAAISSGLHLGKQDQAMHILQINAFGALNKTPELLCNSDVNTWNQDRLLELLQESLQLNERKAPQNLMQRWLGIKPRSNGFL